MRTEELDASSCQPINRLPRGLWGVALVALVARLATLIIPVRLNNDAVGYWKLATSLLENGTLSLNGSPSAMRLPGYPTFVAVVRLAVDRPEAVVVSQALLGGVNTMLVGVLALRLLPGGRRRPAIAMVAGGAWALYPYALIYVHRVITETLSVTLLLAAAVVISTPTTRPWVRSALLGLAWVMLTYVKPTFLFFLPCWLLYRVVRSPGGRVRALATTSIAVVVFAVAYAPWPIRNQRVMGTFVFGATNFGQSFFNGVYGFGTLGDPWDFQAAEYGPEGASAEERSRREALLKGIKGLPEVEKNRALARLTARLVAEDPAHFARNALLTIPRVWLRFPWEVPPTVKGLALTLMQAFWLAWAVRGWFRLRCAQRDAHKAGRLPEEARILILFVEAVVIYTSGVHLVTTPVVRYSFPALALLCACIGHNAGKHVDEEK